MAFPALTSCHPGVSRGWGLQGLRWLTTRTILELENKHIIRVQSILVRTLVENISPPSPFTHSTTIPQTEKQV